MSKLLSVGKNVVLVEGVRTPFTKSLTLYEDLMAYQLQRMAFLSLQKRTGLSNFDHIISGTVIQENKTTNLAHEAAVTGNFDNIPCSTVTQACISSNLAVATAIARIKMGQDDSIMCGGVETMSDVPIRFSRAARKSLLKMNSARGFSSIAKILSEVKGKHFSLDLPSVSEFTSGETMGHSADRLTQAFNVSRREQDEFALRSHTLAAEATKKKLLKDVEPVFVYKKGAVSEDNGIRPTTIDKMSTLKPAFIRDYGTVTAANSSFLSDGASACLVMSEDKSKEVGCKPKAYLRGFIDIKTDPKDQCLLGPAYAVPRLLNKYKLSWNDIDVIEMHEAFAGQVLANLKAMDSDNFNTKYVQTKKVGSPDISKLNAWGGSLALGHPFGATGIRLITTAANRLIHENGKLALVTACAAGGHGHAMLVERY